MTHGFALDVWSGVERQNTTLVSIYQLRTSYVHHTNGSSNRDKTCQKRTSGESICAILVIMVLRGEPLFPLRSRFSLELKNSDISFLILTNNPPFISADETFT